MHKKKFIILFFATLLGWSLSFLYCYRIDPEVSFVVKLINNKVAHARLLSEEKRNVCFIGGSSCMFSVNMRTLEDEYGITGCNLGVNAATGRGFQLDLALNCLRENDVLILAFETGAWSKPELEIESQFASKLWFNEDFPFESSKLRFLGASDNYSLTHVRPGGRNLITMALKKLLGRPLYRYSADDIHYGGYTTTDYNDGSLSPASQIQKRPLTPKMIEFILALKKHLEEKNIGLAVSLPWKYTEESIAEEQRLINASLVRQLKKHVYVLEDPYLGVNVDLDLQSDTDYHLSRKGALIRSSIVAESLIKIFPDVVGKKKGNE